MLFRLLFNSITDIVRLNPCEVTSKKQLVISQAANRKRDTCDLLFKFKVFLLVISSISLVQDLLFISRESSHRNGDNKVCAEKNIRPFAETGSLFRVVSAADTYADASAESPSVEAALEDDDEDDEELDSSASNEYPDGDNDNDNDESYEDADDDRQESRIREQWITTDRPSTRLSIKLTNQTRATEEFSVANDTQHVGMANK